MHQSSRQCLSLSFELPLSNFALCQQKTQPAHFCARLVSPHLVRFLHPCLVPNMQSHVKDPHRQCEALVLVEITENCHAKWPCAVVAANQGLERWSLRV